MGLIAIGEFAGASPDVLELGGLFTALAAVVLLAYLNLLDAAPDDYGAIRITTIAAITPLVLTFGLYLLSFLVS
ncbi:hypothetical protein CV102_22500 [Natronococcus pandeyae]|uniref:Uncharacterized protein n=1 Tax=Natronococcus pandeyae TaxID=2055836 RepID=A0A8J8TQ61_9EURY|nr:hypothetical protein [Natronococcus pandeyae]TYL36399.1 hypothetical protein CV102_22500 [Natronococcus pandeyae]